MWYSVLFSSFLCRMNPMGMFLISHDVSDQFAADALVHYGHDAAASVHWLTGLKLCMLAISAWLWIRVVGLG